MTTAQEFKLSGVALPRDAAAMLGEICEHFVEHAEVQRSEDLALLKSKAGTAEIRIEDRKLLIELSCSSEKALQMSRTMLAEHLFYFAGDDPLELTWSDPGALAVLPNIHEATVVSAEDVTRAYAPGEIRLCRRHAFHRRRYACAPARAAEGQGTSLAGSAGGRPRCLARRRGRTPSARLHDPYRRRRKA